MLFLDAHCQPKETVTFSLHTNAKPLLLALQLCRCLPPRSSFLGSEHGIGFSGLSGLLRTVPDIWYSCDGEGRALPLDLGAEVIIR